MPNDLAEEGDLKPIDASQGLDQNIAFGRLATLLTIDMQIKLYDPDASLTPYSSSCDYDQPISMLVNAAQSSADRSSALITLNLFGVDQKYARVVTRAEGLAFLDSVRRDDIQELDRQ